MPRHPAAQVFEYSQGDMWMGLLEWVTKVGALEIGAEAHPVGKVGAVRLGVGAVPQGSVFPHLESKAMEFKFGRVRVHGGPLRLIADWSHD